MNKADLVDLVSERANLSKKESERAVNAVFDGVVEAVAKGEKVAIIGFGNFEKRHRAAKTGRNPSTGEEIQIPATNVPAFKAGKAFKDRLK